MSKKRRIEATKNNHRHEGLPQSNHQFEAYLEKYKKSAHPEQKKFFFDQAVLSNPDNAESNKKLGGMAAEMDLKMAKIYLERSLHQNPIDILTNSTLASVEYKLKNYSNASKYADATLENDPENVIAQHVLGLCYYESKDYDKSLFYLNRIVELRPDCVRFILTRAKTMLRICPKEEVLDFLSDSEDMLMSSYDSARSSAYIFDFLGEHAKAALSYERAYIFQPEKTKLLVLSLNAYFAASDQLKFTELMLSNLDKLMTNLEQFDGRLIEKFNSNMERYSPTENSLSLILEFFDKAFAKEQDPTIIKDTIFGLVYSKLHSKCADIAWSKYSNFEDAVKHLNDAIGINDKDYTIYNKLGIIYAQNVDYLAESFLNYANAETLKPGLYDNTL
ncbi:MAG: tetratricopeptide repeat protein [Rickettsiaceae bacterium]|nr:tetratricopeptide repeat protein [Rickettsiaceae bacterium]